ncbi:MAG TPA: hypothetical protein VFA27_09840 [Vicinamibacterales bacterium]|nr:hypothetical protein [Vicinamibacterales bacterium]
MTNPALLWNAPKPTPRTTRRGEPVFSMTKNGRRLDAELRDHGEFWCEIQFLVDGDLVYGRLWPNRSVALVEAEVKRVELNARGWTPSIDALAK